MKKKLIPIFLLLFAFIMQAQVVAQVLGNECDPMLFPAYNKQARKWGYKGLTREEFVPPTFDKAGAFDGVVAPVMKAGKWGLLNCAGTLSVPTEYEALLQHYDGKIWAQKEGKWGLISITNKSLTGFIFENIKPVHPKRPLVWVSKEGKWGLFNRDKVRYVLDPKFEQVQSLSDSIALIREGNSFSLFQYEKLLIVMEDIEWVKNLNKSFLLFKRRDKLGVVGLRGRVLLPPQYDSIRLAEECFVVQASMGFGLYSFRGKRILFEDKTSISIGSEGYFVFEEKGKKGLITRGVVPVLNPEYDEITEVVQGYCGFKKDGKWFLLSVSRGETAHEDSWTNIEVSTKNKLIAIQDTKYGTFLSDGKGRSISFFAADKIYLDDTLTMMRFEKAGLFGYYNTSSGKMPEAKYKVAKPSNGLMAIASEDGRTYGVLKNEGDWKLAPMAEDIVFKAVGNKWYYQYKQKGKWGLMAPSTTAVLAAAYDSIYFDGRQFRALANNKWGLFSLDGKELSSPQFEKMELAKNYPIVVAKKANFYLMNIKGELLGSGADSIKNLGFGLYAAKTKGKWLLMDGNAKALANAETQLSALQVYSEKLLAAEQNGKWGFLNLAGKWAIKPQFEEVLPFRQTATYVKLNGKWGAINQQGRFLLPAVHSAWKLEMGGIRKLVD